MLAKSTLLNTISKANIYADDKLLQHLKQQAEMCGLDLEKKLF